MIVYRIQDDNGKGPYVGTTSDWMDDFHDFPIHPNPWQEGILSGNREKSNWHCAFESMEQLNRWFSAAELDRLHEKGYRLYKLQVRTVRKGRKQCVFDSRSVVDWECFKCAA